MVRDRRDRDHDRHLTDFRWRDGERLIRFGRGSVAEAVELLGGPGYLLVTTPRAQLSAPAVAAAAAAVHHVAAGAVPPLAATALAWAARHAGGGSGPGPRLVALGGGRVIDVAKAVAAALGEHARALAVPTTLSGAELTRGHRHATGVDEATPRVRCAVVVIDPALAASQPEPALAASALNALGHALEAPCASGANPVATLAANEAACLLVGAFGTPARPGADSAAGAAGPDRDGLALGALLAGYALDSAGYGLHHVLSQTLARLGLAEHGQANAILLPHTIAALARRAADAHAASAAALGEQPVDAARRLLARTGLTRLRELGIGPAELDLAADAAAARPELAATPPRADRAELRAIYAAAL